MEDIMKFFIITMLTTVSADVAMSCASLGDCLTSMQRELDPTLGDAIEFCRIKDEAFNKTLACVKQKMQGCQTGAEESTPESVTQKIASYNQRHNCSLIDPVDAAVRSGSLAICDPSAVYGICMGSLRKKMGELADPDMEKEFCRVKDGLFNETLSCVEQKLATCHPSVAEAYRSNARREIKSYENLHSCSCGDIRSIHELCTEYLPDHADKDIQCIALQEEIECAREEADGCDMEEQLRSFYAPRVVRHSIRHSCCISANSEENAVESTHDFHSCLPSGGVSETEARLVLRALESSAPIRGICGILAKIDRPIQVFRCWLMAARTCTQHLGDYVENKIKRISLTCGIPATTPQLATTSSAGNEVTSAADQATTSKLTTISSIGNDVTSPGDHSTLIDDVTSAAKPEASENPITGTSPTSEKLETKPTAGELKDTTPPADNSGSSNKALPFAPLLGIFAAALLIVGRH